MRTCKRRVIIVHKDKQTRDNAQWPWRRLATSTMWVRGSCKDQIGGEAWISARADITIHFEGIARQEFASKNSVATPQMFSKNHTIHYLPIQFIKVKNCKASRCPPRAAKCSGRKCSFAYHKICTKLCSTLGAIGPRGPWVPLKPVALSPYHDDRCWYWYR